MNMIFSHPMFFITVGGWVLSLWYFFSMRKYSKDGSFVGSFEPTLLFVCMTGLLLIMIYLGITKG